MSTENREPNFCPGQLIKIKPGAPSFAHCAHYTVIQIVSVHDTWLHVLTNTGNRFGISAADVELVVTLAPSSLRVLDAQMIALAASEGDSWVGEMLGFKVEAKRCRGQWWCGYLTAPLAGIEFKDVHGDVTDTRRDKDGLYVYGFDCAHVGDAYPPSEGGSGQMPDGTNEYRSLRYVKSALMKMAEQARDAHFNYAAPAPPARAAPKPHCLRCGGPAYIGFFSATCERVGGCKTMDERIGEPGPLTIAFRRVNNEPRYTVCGVEFPSSALAVAAWKSGRRRILEIEE